MFYPYPYESPKGMGSCFVVPYDGANVPFGETHDTCLDASGHGSRLYHFNTQDPELDLLLGTLDFKISRFIGSG